MRTIFLKVGERVKISVAEPWDFPKTTGFEYVEAQITDSVDTKYGEAYLAKSLTQFRAKGNDINYMIITYRHKDSNHVNAYYIPDDLVPRFKDHVSFEEKLVFIIIGPLVETEIKG